MLIHVSKKGPIGAKHTLIIDMVITMFLCLFFQFQRGLLRYAGEMVGRLFTVSGWWCCSPLYFIHCTRPTVARWGYRYGRSYWRASCCRRNDHRGKTILMIIIVFKVFPNKWHQTLPCDVPVSRYIQASSQGWQVGFPHRSRPPRREPTQTSLQPIPWWRHQMETFSALLALCAGNSPVPVNSPHKGQWRFLWKRQWCFLWSADWVNNREAGDLRRHRGHYDANVMSLIASFMGSTWGPPGAERTQVGSMLATRNLLSRLSLCCRCSPYIISRLCCRWLNYVDNDTDNSIVLIGFIQTITITCISIK